MNKILIIDDDQAIRMLYGDGLDEEGFAGASADGSRAMKLIEKENPDVVVMDVHSAKYDGLDLLRDIRRTYHNLPVILCSDCPIVDYDLKLIAADYYVVKDSNGTKTKNKDGLRRGEGTEILGRSGEGVAARSDLNRPARAFE
jgi:DNA-binding response OmpR family regulator